MSSNDIEQQLREALERGDRDALVQAARELLISDDNGERHSLELQDRLVELGRMVAEMAHELRQPLLGVKAFAQLTESKSDQADYVEKKASAIVTHARRMEEIIERVLRFACGNSRDPEAAIANVNEAASGAVALLGHALRRARITVRLELDEGVADVGIDEISLQQVIVNLLSNARDAVADGGGTILLRTRSCQGGVEVIVADSGPGVAPKMRARLFEPFATGRKDGTGLGLHVCRTIVTRAGGTLTLDDDGDATGARFRVFLPGPRDGA